MFRIMKLPAALVVTLSLFAWAQGQRSSHPENVTMEMLNNSAIWETENNSASSNDTYEIPTRFPQVPSRTLGEFLSQFSNYRTALRLWRTYPLVFFAIGQIGNTVALIVFMQKSMRRFSSYIYLAFLAVFDQISLFGLLLTVIGHVHSPEYLSQGYCQMSVYLQSVSNHVTSWLVVAVATERLIATAIPFKASQLCTVSRAVTACVIIIVVSACLNITVFWTITFTDLNNYPHCLANPQHHDLLEIWQWVDISLFSFIPCVVLFVVNICIIALMQSAKQRHQKLTNSKTPGRGGTNVLSKQITITLLVVSFTFLICTAPTSCLFLWRHITKPERELQTGKADNYVVYILANQILDLIFVNNHCFNIFLYAVTGNRFRSEFVRVFLRCCKKRPAQLEPKARQNVQMKSSSNTGKSTLYELSSHKGKSQTSLRGEDNKAFEH